jgi:uncharacterized protein (DUF488 family)
VTSRFASEIGLGEHCRVPHRIYSVGYEGLEVSRLVDLLATANVTLLIDVRLNAVSRRPGWSKRSLKTQMESAGVKYRHDPALGNPPDNRESFRRGDGEEGRRRMREILGNGSGLALQRLVDDAREQRLAVLCVERGPLRCHRQVITDMAQEIDPSIEVFQIL